MGVPLKLGEGRPGRAAAVVILVSLTTIDDSGRGLLSAANGLTTCGLGIAGRFLEVPDQRAHRLRIAEPCFEPANRVGKPIDGFGKTKPRDQTPGHRQVGT